MTGTPLLPDVTLVAVTSVAMGPTLEALRASTRQANFGQVLLLSNESPPHNDEVDITWRRIDPLASRVEYSRFMLRELADHIATTHALCIQWDGFVLDGSAWDPEFLHYDYIGAVWPQFTDTRNVGNGGFSLRSKGLLAACKCLPFDGSLLEDLVICRQHRDRLESEGMRFAPAAVARRFSFEREVPSGHEFGFHGAHNLVRYLSSEAAPRLFRSLESNMLARSERRELFKWALKHGRLKLAAAMLRRLI